MLKAFDNVSWPTLLEVLKYKEIKYKGKRIISFLYRDQKTVVDIQEQRGEENIRKGVRQSCSLSPPMFDLYSEEAINEVKERI